MYLSNVLCNLVNYFFFYNRFVSPFHEHIVDFALTGSKIRRLFHKQNKRAAPASGNGSNVFVFK